MNGHDPFVRLFISPLRALLLLGATMLPPAAMAGVDEHSADARHAHDHDAAAADDASAHKHHPHSDGEHGDSHAGHAHPGVDLSHPIVVESPLPETKLRLNYGFADGGEGTANVLEVEGEYAFTRNFSVEVVLPYALVNPEEGPSANGLDNAIVAAKFASYALVERAQVLPAVGLEVALPTGDEEEGIGSDHVVELEPFVRVGAWRGKFEVIGTFAVGIPLNQTSEEDDEEDFALAYGASVLYHFTPRVQGLVEFTGESVFGAEDESATYVSPGVTFQPLPDPSVSFGLGATLPLTDDRDFDYAINVMCILHL